MISYFSKLFDYDKAASLKLLNVMLTSGVTPDETVRIFAHMLAAQQIWLLRCKGLPAPGGPLWPDNTIDELAPIIEAHHADWKAWLATLSDADLQGSATYKNTAGQSFTTSYIDIITQVTNHGTHHRGQIGIYLKQNEQQIPGTDYILFSRGLL